MNLENLQLAETAGASPEDHLSNRFKVPEGYALIKQEPDGELLKRITNLIENLICEDVISEGIAVAVHNLITRYAPKHNQDTPSDPLDMLLPCDVTIGQSTIKKGVALRVLVARAKTIHEMLTEQIQESLKKHNQD